MSTAVLERTATAAATEPGPAELQWNAIRGELARRGVGILVAATYDIRGYRGRTHIIALTDVRYGRGLRKFLPGLDVQYTPFPAESAFCSTATNVHVLDFRIWRSRHEEPEIGLPNCHRCLRRCAPLTGLDVGILVAAAGRVRICQVHR